jgi:hypothetical protein
MEEVVETPVHPWKYNGKEFVEMHGLDEYDSKARWYYPAICRTTTMDPLAEKYYSTSPTARLLGEIKSDEVTRTNHKGKYVSVESPISNKKVEESQMK